MGRALTSAGILQTRATMVASAVRIAVVIPHFKGDVVLRALESLAADAAAPVHEIVVVDDGPGDLEVLREVVTRFPEVRIVKTAGSWGYGGACDAGIAATTAPLIVLINNDVQVAPGFLTALLAAGDAHPEAALFQAKVRSQQEPTKFDYAGAAGGQMDRLGYPFAMGRLFDAVEEDTGQYDRVGPIFWACGAAMMVRRSSYVAVGGFDPSFYMHMEELDLAWRLQLAGYAVHAVPAAVARHLGGYTLSARSFQKTCLNYRNNWVLLLKNLAPTSLARVIPQRLALDLTTVIYGLLNRDWRTPLAALLGVMYVMTHLPSILRRRRAALRTQTVPFAAVEARLYPRSVVWARFARGVDTVCRLPGLDVAPTAAPAPAPIAAPQPTTSRPAISVIVPTWNEALNIPRLLKRVAFALRSVPHEILVVDDGSPDGTAALAEGLARTTYPAVRVIRRTGERGLSRAIVDGFDAARGDVLAVIDADLQHDAKLLPLFVAQLRDHDLAVGSRYSFRGGCRGWSFLRRMESRAAAMLTRLSLGITVKDPLSGFFAIRREVFAGMRTRLATEGWKILMEVLAADPSLRVVETGYTFRSRRFGKSKMRPDVIRAWLSGLSRLRREAAAASAPAPVRHVTEYRWSPAT